MSETDRPILNVTCPNPECRHPFKMYRPDKPGIVKVGCPKCKKQFPMQIPANAFAPADNSGAPTKRIPVEETPDDIYRFPCPHCGGYNICLKGGGRNLLKVTCPKCKGNISVSVDRPTPQTELVSIGNDSFEEEFEQFDSEDSPKISTALRVFTKRRFLPDIKTDYTLKNGNYTIGREDSENQPEIPISGDVTVSRRSVRLEVFNGHDGDNQFNFTVMKAVNPVTVNGKRLMPGESIFLTIGNKIRMGKTDMELIKENHKK